MLFANFITFALEFESKLSGNLKEDALDCKGGLTKSSKIQKCASLNFDGK